MRGPTKEESDIINVVGVRPDLSVIQYSWPGLRMVPSSGRAHLRCSISPSRPTASGATSQFQARLELGTEEARKIPP